MNIATFFENILEKPELYLGIRSVSRLHSFVSGYIFAQQEMNPEFDATYLWEFYRWVSGQYNIQTTHSWADVILFMSLNDESKAIDKATELWELYKSEMSSVSVDERVN